MIKQTYLFYFLALILTACSSNSDGGNGNAKAEFGVLCAEFTTLAQSTDFSQRDSEERAERLELVLAKNLNTTGNAYISWTAIRNGPPSERYNFFKESAASSGYPEWRCPAIAQHGHEVGSSHD